VETGNPKVDDAAEGVLGQALTAHPHFDAQTNRMVSWTWAQRPADNAMSIEVCEWDTSGVVARTPYMFDGCVAAPHDFGVTQSYYVFQLNAFDFNTTGFLTGSAPASCLSTTAERGVEYHLIPRPDGPKAGTAPIVFQTDDAYFGIHHACAVEDATTNTVKLYTAGWPTVTTGPFLSDWGGATPDFDEIQATLLFETTLDPASQTASRRVVAGGASVDHPHIDPREEGGAVDAIYMSFANTEGVSSPPVGWLRYDRSTGATRVWRAPPRTFTEEIVVIPKTARLRMLARWNDLQRGNRPLGPRDLGWREDRRRPSRDRVARWADPARLARVFRTRILGRT